MKLGKTTFEEFLQTCTEPHLTELGTSVKGNRKVLVYEIHEYTWHDEYYWRDDRYTTEYYTGFVISPDGIILEILYYYCYGKYRRL